MSKKKEAKKGKKKGGAGKAVFAVLVLLGCAGAGFWYLAPDAFQAQVDNLKGLLGL